MNMFYRFLSLNRKFKAKTPDRRLCLPFVLSAAFSLSAFVVATGLVQPNVAVAQETSNKAGMKDRLNKIFYWHLSDELKLSPTQEKNVIAKLNEVQTKREEALKVRQESLESLQKLPKDAPLSKTKPFLDKYISSSEILAGLDKEEYNGLKEVLGEELLARFYIIREDVTSRVRAALKK